MDGIEENEKSLSDSMDNWDEPQDMGKFWDGIITYTHIWLTYCITYFDFPYVGYFYPSRIDSFY
jgi:hypothetical protein